MRKEMKDSTIIALGILQMMPTGIMICASSTIIIVLGVLWAGFILAVWNSTIIGRAFLRKLWRATLRLEYQLFGDNTEC